MPITEPTESPLDSLYCVETPEGSDLVLRPAGVGVRIQAYLLDLLFKFIAVIALSTPLAILGGFGNGVLLVIIFLLQWFYPVCFELWREGQTPGKKSLGIRVVNDDGTPVTFGASLLRNLLRTVDFLPLFYVSGVITSVISHHFQRLGDLAAGTLVIYVQQAPQPLELETTGQIAIPLGFTTDEQRAILAFAERSRELSPDRQQELAGLLQPLLPPGEPVLTLKQMANSLVGRS